MDAAQQDSHVADADVDRFEQMYRRHFRPVLRYALARLEPERARDVAAETFLIAWRRLGELPPEPAAWLFAVARKVIAGQLRADARRAALSTRLTIVHARGGDGADPAEEFAQRDSALSALARLSEPDREILLLIAWDGLPPPLAASVLGISRLNFAVRLHRARKRLAVALAAADAISPTRNTEVSHARQQ
jgi:RNA polymerase sigma-70 factor (ECF subfamily)